ncbi:YcnI family copper-binding membrane protein [Saccharopolyspora rosea]|uniref:YcnI family protein n=1 Tax=Saccharopolyspora rosea TaxID=524884 RepID=A0ABW3FUJ4_9PSEU|nr:YcnI family protein [Saccharopolyspora rosea]
MSTNRIAARSAAVASACGILALIGAGTASAHVTAQPKEVAKGGYAKIAFRVPNERPNAGTVQVRVDLPLDHPISSASTKPMPGWTAQVDKVKLDKPVEVDGAKVTDAVRSITWTAQPGTRIGPEQFDEFEVSLGTIPGDTDQLVMPAEQTYDNGEVVRWADPQPPGAPEPEHPAPTVKLVADEEAGHGTSGHGTAPAAPQQTSDDTARWLGGAGLVVGALGLGLGGGALLRGRGGRP